MGAVIVAPGLASLLKVMGANQLVKMNWRRYAEEKNEIWGFPVNWASFEAFVTSSKSAPRIVYWCGQYF